MNVLLLGSGGREHALAWKISHSKLLTKLWIAPGNAGTASIGVNVNLDILDFNSIADFCLKEKIQTIIVGSEAPLVMGIYDYFKNNEHLSHIYVFGPSQQASLLEGSKAFAKTFMKKYNIPTAGYQSFTKNQYLDGLSYLETRKFPIVLKADGLAAGKGVVICDDLTSAQAMLKEMLQEQKFGEASNTVVIEDFLQGIELSCFVITDGKDYLILPEAKDYKRIGENDTGLNTGGMGAVSPVPFADKKFMNKIEQLIIQPTIKGLKNDGLEYYGFIFFGLINVKGEPYVIEYNARMGDPETEVVIPRLKNDLLELILAAFKHELHLHTIQQSADAVATVMLVAGGYPEKYESGNPILNLDKTKDCIAFHAGTKQQETKILTNGGRVISISAYGIDIASALKACYENAQIIDFKNKYYRKDIGNDLLNYDSKNL